MKILHTSDWHLGKRTAGRSRLDEQRAALAEIAEIAKEEKVPPYIVFSDKTLVHMCQVRPENKAQMLKVSGVGEFKYQKYGERFLEVILN